MFRKYYKDANNDIKPSEEFINSVIENARKSRPPMIRRYAKYAASAAAALVIVSAAVISMPVWQDVMDDDGGVIVEEIVTQTTPPQSAVTDPPVSADGQITNTAEPSSPPSGTSKHSYIGNADVRRAFSGNVRSAVPVLSGAAVPEKNEENGVNTSVSVPPYFQSAVQNTEKNTNSRSGTEQPSSTQEAEHENDAESTLNPAQFAAYMEIYNRIHGKFVPDSNDVTVNNSQPTPAAASSVGDSDGAPSFSVSGSYEDVYEEDNIVSSSGGSSGGSSRPASGSGSSNNADSASAPGVTEDNAADSVYIPTPSGYRCEYRTDKSASFVSENGARITVNVYYSGASYSSPSYSENGDSIAVSMTVNGMRIEIHATGADKSSVEELVNYF